MHTTRRSLLQLSIAGAAGLALGGFPAMARPTGGKKILILGGTGFLGPALIDSAKARGHTVTLFNRGRTEKRKPGQFQDDEKIYGNRDPKLRAVDNDPTSAQGLSALEGERTWDAVVDTSGYVPRIVSASAELLAKRVGLYVFVSSVSAYSTHATENDESAPTATMPDPTSENVQAHYGALKALCEQAAEKACPGRTFNVRPGFIVGPGDPTDRFTYWPVRATRGGKMLAPGKPEWPIQIIDVRDLADFIITGIERNTTGVFNATGPAATLGFGSLVNDCIAAAKRSKPDLDTTPVWVDWEFLKDKQADFTVWVPPIDQYAGFHKVNISKALAAGLMFRPTVDTCADTIAWWPKEVERRRTVGAKLVEDAKRQNAPLPNLGDPEKLRVGLTEERERQLLEEWANRSDKPAGTP